MALYSLTGRLIRMIILPRPLMVILERALFDAEAQIVSSREENILSYCFVIIIIKTNEFICY
jgi:hypothetical protein